MGLKQRVRDFLSDMIFGHNRLNYIFTGRNRKYGRKVGDLGKASVVMAPVMWVMRQLSSAPMMIENADGERTKDHAMLHLLRRPNQYYGGRILKMAIAHDLVMDGNAYVVKVRNNLRAVVELWYVPYWMIYPDYPQDGSEFISHYVYTPGGREIYLDPDDVIHIRFGIDPQNQRRGLSPLKALLVEIFTDNEAANFAASVLENGGVPGLVISPKEGTISKGDVDAVKDYIENKFGGDNRGKPLALSGPTEVKEYGYSPAKMNLSAIRNIPEERVCACIGVAAAEVGFGTGVQQTKVGATMQELRRKSYEDAVIPLHELIADELETTLLPDFEPSPEQWSVVWDYSGVQMLQEDENKRWERLSAAVQAGWMTVAEAQRQAGLEVDDSQEVYLRGLNIVETTAVKMRSVKTKGKKSEADINEVERAYVQEMNKRRERIAERWAGEQVKEFDRMGDDFAAMWEDQKSRKALEDEVKIDRIINSVNWGEYAGKALLYEQLYLSMAQATIEGLNVTMGLGVNLTDPIERAVIEQGGIRKGLVDLSGQTKQALLDAVKEARELGYGDEGVSRLIRDKVPKGRYKSARTRADIIARTETRYAQNIAAHEAGKEAGATGYRVIDGQMATSDDYCISVNGITIRPNEVERFAAEEHPNGTRDFVPLFQNDLEYDTIPVER